MHRSHPPSTDRVTNSLQDGRARANCTIFGFFALFFNIKASLLTKLLWVKEKNNVMLPIFKLLISHTLLIYFNISDGLIYNN